MISVTGPQEFRRADERFVDELTDKIEKGMILKKELLTGGCLYIDVIVEGEYSAEIRQAVCARYVKAGWKRIAHSISSETEHDRPGLTGFKFYF